MNATTQTLVRSVLKILCGILVTKGVTDNGTAEILVGALTGLVAVAWGYYHRQERAKSVPISHRPAGPSGKPPSPTPPILSLLGTVMIGGVLLFTPGCVTDAASRPTPQAVAYFTLADTRALVDAAERAYGRAVAAGRVTPDQERDVDEKIIRFHASYKLAVRAARTNYSTLTPPDVQKLADALVATIYTFAQKE